VTDPPLFSRCVIGYRAWLADAEDRLWPLHARRRPWVPGVNTARCDCKPPIGTTPSHLIWTGPGGFAHAPTHAAPAHDCTCGLYSWREPRARWAERARLPRVVGAVASWGAIEVHDHGFRAEHACAVVLAWAHDEDLERLTRIATTYRAELVPLSELRTAALHHGEPLPESLRPAPQDPPTTTPDRPRVVVPAPDLTPDEVPATVAIGFDGHPLDQQHHLGFTGFRV
jgi:hypothetical protein